MRNLRIGGGMKNKFRKGSLDNQDGKMNLPQVQAEVFRPLHKL